MSNKIEVNVEDIKQPVVTAKVVEEKENGIVVERLLITSVKFEYEGSPAALENVLWALRARAAG